MLIKISITTLSIIVLISALLYAFAPHPPRVPQTANNQSELNDAFQAIVDGGGAPAMSVVVIKDGSTIYSEAFGNATETTQATPDTVYHWWSVTKLFTAVSILQLHEQGKLDIDDTVTNYVPFFEVEGENGSNPPITIRQLLNHTSGLGDTMPAMIGWIHNEDETYNQTELLREQLPNFNKLRFEPGTDAAYTNLGYIVLSAVVEAASEQSYESYIVEHVTGPLGMNNTDFIYQPHMQQHEAAGTHPIVNMFTPFLPFMLDMDMLIESRQGNRWWLNRFYIDATGPTGLIGSSNDAAQFMQAYLDGGMDMLSTASVAMMTAGGEKRPLGWAEFGEDSDRYWIQHRGGGPGFATIMRLYPEENLGITILVNGTDLDSENLVSLVANSNFTNN